jgi:hypothetical protein
MIEILFCKMGLNKSKQLPINQAFSILSLESQQICMEYLVETPATLNNRIQRAKRLCQIYEIKEKEEEENNQYSLLKSNCVSELKAIPVQ